MLVVHVRIDWHLCHCTKGRLCCCAFLCCKWMLVGDGCSWFHCGMRQRARALWSDRDKGANAQRALPVVTTKCIGAEPRGSSCGPLRAVLSALMPGCVVEGPAMDQAAPSSWHLPHHGAAHTCFVPSAAAVASARYEARVHDWRAAAATHETTHMQPAVTAPPPDMQPPNRHSFHTQAVVIEQEPLTCKFPTHLHIVQRPLSHH